MQVYDIEVNHSGLAAKAKAVELELKKIYAVKHAEVDIVKSMVKIILDENGSINCCKTVLVSMGITEKKHPVKRRVQPLPLSVN